MLDMRFHPDVEQEVDSAYAWYETQVTGLGEDFLHELENGLVSVQTMPETWTVVIPGFRRYLLQKFPYGIIYQIVPHAVLVVAVTHLNRKSGYWQQRV